VSIEFILRVWDSVFDRAALRAMKHFSAATLLIGVTALGAEPACCQPYPHKPIRIVTSEVGGGTDFTARLIAQGLSAGLGQQVIVDNRAAGIIPGEIVSRAIPDGYTLLVHTSSFWLGPLLRKTPYDPLRNFLPVTLATKSSNILVVHPSVAAKSVKELITLARSKPGEFNYASASTGGTPHLAAELFKAMAAVDIVRIPYKGTGPALNALIGGEVQLSFPSASAAVLHVKAGRLRALAVTTSQPSALAPGLPTVSETVPGYESVQMYGVFAPARTPENIINRISQESAKFLNVTKTKELFLASGVEAVGSSPHEFGAAVRSEISRMGKVIKDAGIREE
jgi:tripartite-type tricarboxylate transporter receptor subunit TctC